MAAADPGFAAIAPSVRAAYFNYLVGPRNPTVLKPIGVLTPTADWIRKKYKTAPKSLALDWITAARNDHDLFVCPMCGGTSIATLEHVLPKADYPEFSVLSFNMVPSCDGCQRKRSNKGARYEFIHPYFDLKILASLRLVVTFTPPYDRVLFKLLPGGLAGTDLQRTQRHLDESLPPVLFRRHMRRLWSKWHGRCHGQVVADAQLRISDELVEAELEVVNSWEVAFLRGLSQDLPAISWMRATPP
jgi:hypothetical protein